jgi:hypothetical protein
MVGSQITYRHYRPALILFAIIQFFQYNLSKREYSPTYCFIQHETWSQDLPVENRFSKFENKPLMKIIGPGRRGRRRKLERKLYK